MANLKSAYPFCPGKVSSPLSATDSFGNFGFHWCHICSIRNTYAIICMASYRYFYFSNFDLPHSYKYCVDFNPVKCITNYKALATNDWNGTFIEGV